MLVWFCISWILPYRDPQFTVFVTSPFLVAYGIILLFIQYLYNINLTEEEMESHQYYGLNRYHEPPEGANVITIGLKVCLKEICTCCMVCKCLVSVLYMHNVMYFHFKFVCVVYVLLSYESFST